MSEMLERVSAVVLRANMTRPLNVDEVRDIARDVITTMRQPTEEMVDAAEAVDWVGPDVWKAMIDAALK